MEDARGCRGDVDLLSFAKKIMHYHNTTIHDSRQRKSLAPHAHERRTTPKRTYRCRVSLISPSLIQKAAARPAAARLYCAAARACRPYAPCAASSARAAHRAEAGPHVPPPPLRPHSYHSAASSSCGSTSCRRASRPSALAGSSRHYCYPPALHYGSPRPALACCSRRLSSRSSQGPHPYGRYNGRC